MWNIVTMEVITWNEGNWSSFWFMKAFHLLSKRIFQLWKLMGTARYLTCSGAVPLETTSPHPNNSWPALGLYHPTPSWPKNKSSCLYFKPKNLNRPVTIDLLLFLSLALNNDQASYHHLNITSMAKNVFIKVRVTLTFAHPIKTTSCER